MKHLNTILMALVIFLPVNLVYAAPEGSTAECKDGSFYSGSSKRGACSRHGGIKEWYGEKASATTSSAATTTGQSMQQQQMPAKAPTAPPAPVTTSETMKDKAMAGGSAQVWVNTQSKVYHCPGSRWYGTTKQGEYMSESQAISQGIRADHNKACNK